MPLCLQYVLRSVVGICRAFFIFILCGAQILFTLPVRAQQGAGETAQGVGREDSQSIQDSERHEIIEFRTPTSKTFSTIEGYVTESYAERIHTLQKGRYVPIDNTLTKDPVNSALWKNGANDYVVQFSEKASEQEPLETTTYKGAKIASRLKGQHDAVAKVNENSINYQEILPYINVQYTAYAELVKGDIILNSMNALDDGVLPIVEYLNVNEGTELRQTGNRDIQVVHKGEEVWSLTAPSMVDAEGRRSAEIDLILEQDTSESYTLTIQPSHEWLQSATYPVRIDPDAVLGSSVTAYTESASPNTATWPQRLLSVGNNTVDGYYKGRTRTFASFTLPRLPDGVTSKNITRADAVFYEYVQYKPFEARVQKITSDWDPATLTDRRQPTVDEAQATTWIDGTRHYTWEVTAMVQDWYSDPSQNFGLRIVSTNESTQGGLFRSQYYPGAPEDQKPHIDLWHSAPNIAPNIPELGDPANGALLGGGSMGNGVGVTFSVRAEDPNNDVLNTTITATSSDGKREEMGVGGVGWQQAQATLPDGQWVWTAQTTDGMISSQKAPEKSFMVDTTPPSQPILHEEPRYTSGYQNEITASISSDDGVGGVIYTFQCAEDEKFETNLQELEAEVPRIGFAGLQDGAAYFYRVRTRDRLGNQTNWSPTVTSTQDATAPVIEHIELSQERISPENQDGVLDSTQLAFEIQEDHPASTTITLRHESGEQIVQSTMEGSILLGEQLQEGAYTIQVIARDKAGNVSETKELILIVDNTPPEIQVARPRQNLWVSTERVTLTGQVDSTSQLTIESKGSSQETQLTIDPDGLYTTELNLQHGENAFVLRAIDTVGNQQTREIIVNKETEAPTIEIQEPMKPFSSNETIIVVDAKEVSQWISGIEPSSLGVVVQNPNGVAEWNLNGNDPSVTRQCSEAISETQGSKECGYRIALENLSQDGIFALFITVADIAGNSNTLQGTFERDTIAVLHQIHPYNGDRINTTTAEIQVEAERGSTLQLNAHGWNASVTIEPREEENTKVTDCHESNEGGAHEICTVTMNKIPLPVNNEKGVVQPVDIQMQLEDQLGNRAVIADHLEVDIFANELSFQLDSTAFSPNGDGHQDRLRIFDIQSDATIVVTGIRIQQETEIIAEWQREGIPYEQYWDGTRQSGGIVPDATYTIDVFGYTDAGILVEAPIKKVDIRTQFENDVVITSPKDEHWTTSSVIAVAGQAPENTVITLCDEIVGMDIPCLFQYVVNSTSEGYFETKIELKRNPDSAQTVHQLWAFATDHYGNQTTASPRVTIILDTSPPFVNVGVSPALVAQNTPEIYQQYLKKEVEKEELSSLQLNAVVTRGTMDYEVVLRESATLSDNNDRANEVLLVSREDQCQESQCQWVDIIVVPPLEGGLYEVVFRASKAGAVSEVADSMTVDAIIPRTPTILRVNTITEEGKQLQPYEWEQKHYTKRNEVAVYGVAEPNAQLQVLGNDKQRCTPQASIVGIFFCRISIPKEETPENTSTEIQLQVVQEKGAYHVEGEVYHLVIDHDPPKILQQTADHQWIHSGMESSLQTTANELIARANTITPSGFIYQAEALPSMKAQVKVVVTQNVQQGRYQPQTTIEDLAGNTASQQFTFFVDNTPPQSPKDHITEILGQAGYENTEKKLVKSRLHEGYVQSTTELELPLEYEQYSSLHETVNGTKATLVKSGSEECSPNDHEVVIDTVSVVQGKNCITSLKIPIDPYGQRIAIQQQDQAQNLSTLSNDFIVYSDTDPPMTPIIQGGQYTTTEDHKLIRMQGEPKSDLVINIEGTGNRTEEILQFDEFGEAQKDISLPEIGTYGVHLKSVDAAGNTSEETTVTLNRVRPLPVISTIFNGTLSGLQTLINRLKGIKGDTEDRLDRVRFLDQWKDTGKHASMSFRVDADGNSTLKYANIAPPLLYDASDNGAFFHADGVALNKYSTGRVYVEYEIQRKTFGWCWPFWSCRLISEWKNVEKDIDLPNTKVSLYADSSQDQFAETWNDGDELWEVNIDMQDQLREGHTVTVMSRLYGDFNIELPERGWVNIDYRQNGRGVSSSRSNELQIGASIKRLKELIQQKLGVELRDGAAGWDRDELEYIWKTIQLLPPEMYQNSSVKFIQKQGEGSVACYNSQSTVAYLPSDGTELHICNLISKIGSDLESYRSEALASIVHEFIHIYQKNEGGNIAKLPNVGTSTYRFYDLLFQKNNAGYFLFTSSGDYWGEGAEIAQSGREDFVSYYAYSAAKEKPSYSLGVPVPNDLRRPQEFMAEAVTNYFLNPYHLQTHQTFTNAAGGRVMTDLYEFIKNNIDK